MVDEHRIRSAPHARIAPTVPWQPPQTASHAAACHEWGRVHVPHRYGVNAIAQDIPQRNKGNETVSYRFEVSHTKKDSRVRKGQKN